MIANINPKTGIAYGVINANEVPYLLEEIINNGNDVSYQSWKKEVIDNIASILENHVNGEDGVDCLSALIADMSWKHKTNSAKEDVKSSLDDLQSDGLETEINFTTEAEAIFDSFDLNETYENDEGQYEHSEGKGKNECKYILGYLGGAPLIWVIQSPYLTHARKCSPCVPNAGDLNNLDVNGVECYDVPPEYKNSDEN